MAGVVVARVGRRDGDGAGDMGPCDFAPAGSDMSIEGEGEMSGPVEK
jgi:hypothetical protein